MSLLEKVRIPKIRPPEASPKEKEAWKAFTELAEAMGTTDEVVAPIVMTELQRLCDRGNPIAIRFKERLDISKFQPRRADEAPLPRPEPRRIAGLQWGRPKAE